ncbi:MAG: hypothetical protein VX463_19265, partial [Pseudomonadota bacterium]|nr:hypothetical protein [Pseudomonadota bacterium]
LAAIGPEGTMDRGVMARISRDGPPPGSDRRPAGPRRPQGDRRPHRGKGGPGGGSGGGKRPPRDRD